MTYRAASTFFIFSGVSALGLAAACSSSSTTGTPDDAGTGTVDAAIPTEAAPEDAAVNPLPGCTADPGAPATTFDLNASSDPAGGAASFTIAHALAGFPEGAGVLTALITTELGAIRCTLDESVAPASVANFIGLARGTRPYKDGAKWKVGRFYDGLVWHRVIPDFVIQGGDPDGDGTGGPGYDLIEENHVDEPLGTLAMAASDAPSGSQFYIVVGTGPQANYNVFGTCATETAKSIAAVPRDSRDKPKTEVHMLRVDIGRCPAQ